MMIEMKSNLVNNSIFLNVDHSRYILDHISYIPGKDRERPYQLELVIKTKQSIAISFEFEMAFLKWNEFPPDPNHGFYIPSAVISTILPSKIKSNYILRSLSSFSLNQRLNFDFIKSF
jgi:hypothetical protein